MRKKIITERIVDFLNVVVYQLLSLCYRNTQKNILLYFTTGDFKFLESEAVFWASAEVFHCLYFQKQLGSENQCITIFEASRSNRPQNRASLSRSVVTSATPL
jgi:hypothetical protein